MQRLRRFFQQSLARCAKTTALICTSSPPNLSGFDSRVEPLPQRTTISRSHRDLAEDPNASVESRVLIKQLRVFQVREKKKQKQLVFMQRNWEGSIFCSLPGEFGSVNGSAGSSFLVLF